MERGVDLKADSKKNPKFIINFVIALTYFVATVFIIVLYAINGDLSEVYYAFIPLAITAIACVVMNKTGENEKD